VIEGRSLREIARALGCSRHTVREVRDGLRVSPAVPKSAHDPLWMLQMDWPAIIHDLGLGHPLKFLWEEKAQHLTTYSNFWKQFYRKFPQYRQASITAGEFVPGERVEVDYAGEPLEWIEMKTGEIRKAYVFVAGLGFSQLLFAWAAEDMKSRNWLGSHRRMYADYGGVPQKLLSQSRFIHSELNRLFVELFNTDVYGNLRRAQGFVRSCTKEINAAGHELASERIAAAIATMRRYNRYREPYFQALLAQARKQVAGPDTGREIVRRPGNPMLRYAPAVTDDSTVATTSPQESLNL
jgi:hypothetical protein